MASRVGIGLVVAGIVLGAVWRDPDRADGSGGVAPREPSPSAAGKGPKRPFTVFDATFYRGKPDLREYGVKPLKVLYGNYGFWRKTGPKLEDVDRSIPEESAVRQRGRELASEKTEMAVVDIEHWPLKGSDAKVRESIDKYVRVLNWLRAEAPQTKIGYYGAPPLRNYWTPVQGRGRSGWEAENRRLTPIAELSDVLFPSLYTFYNDRAGWIKYANANLEEARKYGKPLYAFLWPQYHPGNRKIELQDLEYLPGDFWRLELETCYGKADGVVIWGGYKQTWDPKAPWWQETVKFLRERGLSPDGGPRE